MGSILSKKLAVGAAGIVFDVKWGTGAVHGDPSRWPQLARMLSETSKNMGRKACALVTDMNQPLGSWVGHASELKESIETLEGNGPQDTLEVSFQLCEALGGSARDSAPTHSIGTKRSVRDALENAFSSGPRPRVRTRVGLPTQCIRWHR